MISWSRESSCSCEGVVNATNDANNKEDCEDCKKAEENEKGGFLMEVGKSFEEEFLICCSSGGDNSGDYAAKNIDNDDNPNDVPNFGNIFANIFCCLFVFLPDSWGVFENGF